MLNICYAFRPEDVMDLAQAYGAEGTKFVYIYLPHFFSSILIHSKQTFYLKTLMHYLHEFNQSITCDIIKGNLKCSKMIAEYPERPMQSMEWFLTLPVVKNDIYNEVTLMTARPNHHRHCHLQIEEGEVEACPVKISKDNSIHSFLLYLFFYNLLYMLIKNNR